MRCARKARLRRSSETLLHASRVKSVEKRGRSCLAGCGCENMRSRIEERQTARSLWDHWSCRALVRLQKWYCAVDAVGTLCTYRIIWITKGTSISSHHHRIGLVIKTILASLSLKPFITSRSASHLHKPWRDTWNTKTRRDIRRRHGLLHHSTTKAWRLALLLLLRLGSLEDVRYIGEALRMAHVWWEAWWWTLLMNAWHR